jgi:hypothetical protein
MLSHIDEFTTATWDWVPAVYRAAVLMEKGKYEDVVRLQHVVFTDKKTTLTWEERGVLVLGICALSAQGETTEALRQSRECVEKGWLSGGTWSSEAPNLTRKWVGKTGTVCDWY